MADVVALIALVAVYGAVIVRQVAGRGPDPYVTFAVGAVGVVVLGVVSIAGAESALTSAVPVLLFLFALFLFAAELERAGAIDHVARWLVGRARRPADLPAVLFLGFGLASTFLVNDALVLLGVPLLLAVARRLEVEAKPLLLTLAFSVTVGSVLTPLGNPQNLLVSLSSGIHAPVATFLRYLLLPTIANLAIGAIYLRWAYRSKFAGAAVRHADFRRDAPPLFPRDGWGARLRTHPSLVIFPVTVLVLVTVDVVASITGGPEPPITDIALGGAVVLLLLVPARVALVRRVDWSILLLFAGLFVVVAGAEAAGVTAALERLFVVPPAGASTSPLPSIAVGSLLGPQVVSNVPWVALQIPLLQGLGYGAHTPIAWVALSGESTLAGNLTLLGAASNLIVVTRARHEGVEITLGDFAREGIPIAAMTIVVLAVALAFGL